MCDWLCLYINTPTKTKSNESILMFCPGTTTSAWERGWMAALRTLTSCRRKCRWGKWFYQIIKWEMKSFQMKIVKMIWFLNLSRSPPCCRDRWKAGFDRCWTGGRPPEVRIFILNSLPIFFYQKSERVLIVFFWRKGCWGNCHSVHPAEHHSFNKEVIWSFMVWCFDDNDYSMSDDQCRIVIINDDQ